MLRTHKSFYYRISEDPHERHRAEQFKYAADMNYDNESCVFTINACKSFGIPKAVTINKATTHRGIQHISGST
eukprot:4170111-Prorocentrum_lima.AAC.1